MQPMDFIISVIQGITEFLPVSSTLHIYAACELFGYSSHASREIVYIAHSGSLIAAVICIIYHILIAKFNILHIIKYIYIQILSIIPLTIFVLFTTFILDTSAVAEWSISLSTSLFINGIAGFVLFAADAYGDNHITSIRQIHTHQIVIFGLLEVCAFIFPGLSRSGIIITAARMMNMSRQTALTVAIATSIPALTGTLFMPLIVPYALNGEQLYQILSNEYLYIIITSAITSIFSIIFIYSSTYEASFKAIALYRMLMGIALTFYIKLAPSISFITPENIDITTNDRENANIREVQVSLE